MLASLNSVFIGFRMNITNSIPLPLFETISNYGRQIAAMFHIDGSIEFKRTLIIQKFTLSLNDAKHIQNFKLYRRKIRVLFLWKG